MQNPLYSTSSNISYIRFVSLFLERALVKLSSDKSDKSKIIPTGCFPPQFVKSVKCNLMTIDHEWNFPSAFMFAIIFGLVLKFDLAVAERIATERGEAIGDTVGYQVTETLRIECNIRTVIAYVVFNGCRCGRHRLLEAVS